MICDCRATESKRGVQLVTDGIAIVLFVVATLFAVMAAMRVNINLGYIQHHQPGFVRWSGVLSATAMAVALGIGGWFLLTL